MTVARVAETDRSDTVGVTAATRAVDPVTLAAEMRVRLAEQGSAPGPRADDMAAIRAVQALLAAWDIPELDDPLAIARLVARRSVALVGVR